MMSIGPDLENLYQRYQHELTCSLTQMLRCSETAAELVQESYLVLARSAELAPIDHPRGFLHRVAKNLAFDYLRHQKVERSHYEKFVPVQEPEAPSAEQNAAELQRRELIREVINELPPRCREVFVLHKLQGKSYREIARELDISESGVEKHMIRGLDYCRRRILERSSRQPGTEV